MKNYNETLEELFKVLYKTDNLELESTEDEEKTEEEWWTDNFFENILNHEDDIIKIKSQIFTEYDQQLISYYLEKYSIPDHGVQYISAKNSSDVKFQQTIEAINNPKIRLIVNPHFKDKIETENHDIECVATFTLFDKKLKKIVMSKYSSKIQLEYSFYSVFFYDVLKSLGITVNDISVIALSPFQEEPPKKGVLNFFESFNSRLVKSFKVPKKDKSDKMLVNLFNTGEILVNPKYIQAPITFMTYCTQRCFHLDYRPINPKQEGNNIINISWPPFCDVSSNKNTNNLFKLENYKDIVLKNKEFIRTDYDLNFAHDLKKYIHETQVIYDDESSHRKGHSFKFCSSGSLIETKTKNLLIMLYNGNIYHEVSNNYYNHNNSASDKKRFYLVKNSYIANADFIEYKNAILKSSNDYIDLGCLNLIGNIHVKDSVTVWYDYEGFSSPFPIIDYYNSYNQVINQVSVIVTKNGVTQSVENIVVDPLKEMNMVNLVKMIYAIYSNKADNYVVYNKGYENARNLEILKVATQIFLKNKHDSSSLNDEEKEFITFLDQTGGIDKLTFKINWIVNNTIDLADCFRVSTTLANLRHNDINYFSFNDNNGVEVVKEENLSRKQSLFNQFIYLKELKYRYSIKKIEHLISNKELKLKKLIKPYSELVIQKGTMAMTEAIARYAGITGDNVWNKRVQDLKDYCQNDVEAMIMVYEFIMYLIRIHVPSIDKYEYHLRDDQEYYVKNGKIELIVKK